MRAVTFCYHPTLTDPLQLASVLAPQFEALVDSRRGRVGRVDGNSAGVPRDAMLPDQYDARTRVADDAEVQGAGGRVGALGLWMLLPATRTASLAPATQQCRFFQQRGHPQHEQHPRVVADPSEHLRCVHYLSRDSTF